MQAFFESYFGAWLQNAALALSPVDVFCVLGAMLIIHVCRYAGMWIYALTALPGTVAHELAHFVVAFVLGAQPAFPSLIPGRPRARAADCDGAVAVGAPGFLVGCGAAAPGGSSAVFPAHLDRRGTAIGQPALEDRFQTRITGVCRACAARGDGDGRLVRIATALIGSDSIKRVSASCSLARDNATLHAKWLPTVCRPAVDVRGKQRFRWQRWHRSEARPCAMRGRFRMSSRRR